MTMAYSWPKLCEALPLILIKQVTALMPTAFKAVSSVQDVCRRRETLQ